MAFTDEQLKQLEDHILAKLKERMTLTLDSSYGHYGDETIRVQLKIDNELFTEDYFSLPRRDD